METNTNLIEQPIQVECSLVSQESGQKSVHLEIKNVSNSTLHIFDSQRMPYMILQDDGSLLILLGINPPDPDIDYPVIEIPVSQPIEPEQVISYQINLQLLYLKDHYETQREPTSLSGSIVISCQVGWGETPILASNRHNLSINTLLDWQNIAQSNSIKTSLP